ncbi:hypothetical protein L1987_38486 [Smallanthus sonchifolius]|uniref:Uncharacterized protein n=1 Tax=Smallanthus sonchifolius TaxID=185202 RepID=A0ACB9HKJ7_9ASTR|nr:hypothetical protein L1987_38486 [Smallanthus sonchifolius]
MCRLLRSRRRWKASLAFDSSTNKCGFDAVNVIAFFSMATPFVSMPLVPFVAISDEGFNIFGDLFVNL